MVVTGFFAQCRGIELGFLRQLSKLAISSHSEDLKCDLLYQILNVVHSFIFLFYFM